jgi:hypothetical protein
VQRPLRLSRTTSYPPSHNAVWHCRPCFAQDGSQLLRHPFFVTRFAGSSMPVSPMCKSSHCASELGGLEICRCGLARAPGTPQRRPFGFCVCPYHGSPALDGRWAGHRRTRGLRPGFDSRLPRRLERLFILKLCISYQSEQHLAGRLTVRGSQARCPLDDSYVSSVIGWRELQRDDAIEMLFASRPNPPTRRVGMRPTGRGASRALFCCGE